MSKIWIYWNEVSMFTDSHFLQFPKTANKQAYSEKHFLSRAIIVTYEPRNENNVITEIIMPRESSTFFWRSVLWMMSARGSAWVHCSNIHWWFKYLAGKSYETDALLHPDMICNTQRLWSLVSTWEISKKINICNKKHWHLCHSIEKKYDRP